MLPLCQWTGRIRKLPSFGRQQRDVSFTDASFLSFESLSCPQQNVVHCSIFPAERLLEVQRKNGLDDLEFPCRLDLSVCSVVTAWSAGCTWDEALEMSKTVPSDLARVLYRSMDALHQLGSMPYHPAWSWDAPTKSNLSSFGIQPTYVSFVGRLQVLWIDILWKTLYLWRKSLFITEVVYEFELSAGEDELESPSQSFSMYKKFIFLRLINFLWKDVDFLFLG